MFRPYVVVLLLLVFVMPVGPLVAQTPVFKIEDNTGTALLLVNDDGTITLPTAATNGYVLTTDANGNAAWMPSVGFTLPFQGTHSGSGDAFKMTVDNTVAGSAGVFENTSAGNGDVPLIARTNSLVGTALLVEATGGAASAALRAVSNGTAGRFEGDVEVTGDLEVANDFSCPGCIESSDVNPLGGIYAGKSAIYINEGSQQVPQFGCVIVSATCNDANDLPLQGYCKPAPGRQLVVGWREAENWDSVTNPAAFSCEVCNLVGTTAPTDAAIVCLDVN